MTIASRYLVVPLLALAALVLFGALAGCGERAQTATSVHKKIDGKAWEASSSPYAAAGWKTGDQSAWEEQLRARAQSQNEYTRAK